MLDWLTPEAQRDPVIEIGGHAVPIVLRRLQRARRMTMRLSADGRAVSITLPPWVRSAEAVAFAESRRAWLEKQLHAVPDVRPLTDGETVHYRGVPLRLSYNPHAQRRPRLTHDAIHVGGPQSSLQPRLVRWLQSEARSLLEADLIEYCARADQKVPALALSSAKRRWGSCSADGAIRINWRLVMAPDPVRRSVVAHEVAHLIHFDHSPAFHHCLKLIFEGSVHEANRWLKAHGRGLYLPFG